MSRRIHSIMAMSRVARSHAALSILGAAVGCLLGCSAGDEPSGSLQGTLHTVIVEGHGAQAGAHYFLAIDGRSDVVRLKFAHPPDSVSGTHLTVRGHDDDGTFDVADYDLDPASGEHVGTEEQALTNQTVQRARALAFVPVDFGDGSNVSNADAESFMFSTTNPGPKYGLATGNKSVAQFYNETSYGMFQFSGAVEGPLSWTGDACTDFGAAMTKALTGQITTKYDHYIWYFGSVQTETSCGYGWGSEGTWTKPSGNVWFNGDLFGGAIAHELGHNLGLLHASSIQCAGMPLADDPMTCTTSEYADPIDIMGNLGTGHMMGSEKWYLGWFGACNGVRVKSSGTFTLLPIEIPCNGIQTLQVPMPKTTRTFTTEQSTAPTPARYYYLELRENTGLDTGIKAQVMVHVSDDIKPQNTQCARNVILDMNPATNAVEGLTAGQSYTDPAGGVTITVNSLDTTKAFITVTLATETGASTCMDGSTLMGSGPDTCDATPTGAGGGGGGGASGGSTSTTGAGGAAQTGGGGSPGLGGAGGALGSGGASVIDASASTGVPPDAGEAIAASSSGSLMEGAGGALASVSSTASATGGLDATADSSALNGSCSCELTGSKEERKGDTAPFAVALVAMSVLVTRRRDARARRASLSFARSI